MQQVFRSFTCTPHPDHVDESEELRRRVSTVIESMALHVVTGEDLGGEQLATRDRLAGVDELLAVDNAELPSAFVALETTAAPTSGKPTGVLVRRSSGGPVAGLTSEVPVVALPAEGMSRRATASTVPGRRWRSRPLRSSDRG